MKKDKKHTNFEKYILKCEFIKAESLIKNFSIQKIDESLFTLAYDTGSINPYGFICYLIQKEEKAQYHAIASVLLSHGLVHLPYVFELALFHQKRAITLEPKNIGYKESLFYFNDIPERILSDKDTIIVARGILELDPVNEQAIRALETISKLRRNKKAEVLLKKYIIHKNETKR